MKFTVLFPVFAAGLLLHAAAQGTSPAQPGDGPEPAPLFAASPQGSPPPPAYPLSAFAAVGSSLSQSGHLGELGWSDEQIAAFLDGVRAAFHGKGYPFDNTAERLQAEISRQVGEIETRERRRAVEAFAQPGRLEQYLKEMRKRYSLQQTDSGLCYNVQSGRPGLRPGPGDTVVVSCIATAADGKTRLPQLSSGRVHAKMAGLLPGFMEGLQMMTVDSQAMFILPPSLSFGEGKWPDGVDRGTPLIFFITLHEVISGDNPP